MGRNQDSRARESGSARGSGRGSLETGTPGGARAAPSRARARTDGASPGLTEWATPHRNTPTSGSAARNTFTFCCTKCFFLVLEAKPKPEPGAAVAAGTVAGGTEEDAIVFLSRAPDGVEAAAGREAVSRPRKRCSPGPPSRDRRLARRRAAGRCGAGSAPWRPPAPKPARWVGSPGAGAGARERRSLRAAGGWQGGDLPLPRWGCGLGWPRALPRRRLVCGKVVAFRFCLVSRSNLKPEAHPKVFLYQVGDPLSGFSGLNGLLQGPLRHHFGG